LIGLAVLTAAAFAAIVGNDFVLLDDRAYVTDNTHVAAGLTGDGVRWALTARHSPYWHPLTWISHMADVELWGLDPRGHHLTSLLLHVANALLLAVALARLTGSWYRSLIVAALFALHPLRVESVAWIAERKDLLSACFGLAALWLYASWVRHPRWWRTALVTLALAASLAARPMLVTLPALLLLLDAWPLGRLTSWRTAGRLALEKTPLALLAVASSAITLGAHGAGGAVSALAVVPFGMRLGNAAVAVWRYLAKLVWPVGLTPLYPLVAWPPWIVAAAAAGLVCVTAAVFLMRRSRPYLAVGWLWWCGMLVPVVGIVQVGRQAIADRFTYLPAVGILIAVVWGLGDLMQRWSAPARRGWSLVLGGGAAAVLATLTIRQTGYWRDSVTLFERAVASEPGCADCWRLLGSALLERGASGAALPALERAADLAPGDPLVQVTLAAAHEMNGQARRAAAAYEDVLRRWPGFPLAALRLAWIRAAHSDPGLRDGNRALAALASVPRDLRVSQWELLDVEAAALAETGRFEDAVKAAEAALAAAPPLARGAVAQRLAGYRQRVPFHATHVPAYR
jgi:protein O-mannosyl-transferase